MTGTVVNCFLQTEALLHTIVMEVQKEDIESLRLLIGTAPEFDEGHY